MKNCEQMSQTIKVLRSILQLTIFTETIHDDNEVFINYFSQKQINLGKNYE